MKKCVVMKAQMNLANLKAVEPDAHGRQNLTRHIGTK